MTERESRSVMNVVFRLPTPELEERFIAEAKKRSLHMLVAGIDAANVASVALHS